MDPVLKKLIHRFVGQHISLSQKLVAPSRQECYVVHSLHDAFMVCKAEAERIRSKAASSPCLRPGSTLALRGRGFNPALAQGDAHPPLEPQHKVPRPNGRGLNG